MLHTFWFALNTSGGMSDSDARALGVAHELDSRDDYLDAGRDLLNNEIGISIGNNHQGYAAVVRAVEQAALGGQLWCINSGSGSALGTC